MRCSTPTGASNSSPDQFPLPTSRHQADDTCPNTPTRSSATQRIDPNEDVAISLEPKTVTTNLTRTDSLPHEESPHSRELSGLGVLDRISPLPTDQQVAITKELILGPISNLAELGADQRIGSVEVSELEQGT
jgi:hypothetical protein